MSLRWIAGLGVALLPAPAWPVPLVGAPPQAETQPRQRTVLVLRSAQPLPFSEAELLTALGAQLRELEVEVTTEEGSPSDSGERHTLAMLYIELSQQSLVLHLFQPEGTHLRARQIPFETSNVALLEQIASVVRSAMSALLEDKQAAPAPKPRTAPSPAAPPTLGTAAPEPPPKPALTVERDVSSNQATLSLGALGVGTYVFENRPFEFGLGIEARVAFFPSCRFLSATLHLLPNTEREFEELRLEVARTPLTLVVGQGLATGPVSLEVAVGFLAERLERRIQGESTETDLSAPATHYHLGPVVRTELGWAASDALRFFGGAQVDLLMNPVQYEVAGPGPARTVVSHALPIRPNVLAGLRLRLF